MSSNQEGDMDTMDMVDERCCLFFVFALLRVLDVVALAVDELLDRRPREDVAQVPVVALGGERLQRHLGQQVITHKSGCSVWSGDYRATRQDVAKVKEGKSIQGGAKLY